ncbi:SNF1-related protein kinase regulatory subunit gamma-1 isoform X1 [Carex littledalei]|uniref:SNF1-related protein kinase regulatory subunit gamma-1 isoform X1 n=1 Tax=Carex littledalei TaxID=544730 RepID=A0A833QQA7_9POAL|nr:SNF1-related protein kinase regulatory subunit gamma-1 isoform X1 [Carex littledalei]
MERTLSSPEAEIGIKVEDLWQGLEPQLTPSEKLNSCFKELEVSSFPSTPLSQVIDIPSDSSLREAIEILSKHKILSAPVRDVAASDDASWMERYIGVVEFAGVAMWLLHQFELSAKRKDGTTSRSTDSCESASLTGSFFEALTSSEFYKNTTVRDISGSFRWAPFLAVQTSDSFLTMLLLLSKHSIRSLPVVDFGEGKLVNIITQSAVVHMLAECVGLDWFDNWGNKSLAEVDLPCIKPDNLVKVQEDEPVLKAFELMQKIQIGGLPVVDATGNHAIGNISIRDVQYLLTTPDIYKDYRTITAKDFLTAVRSYLAKQKPESPLLKGVITCNKDDTLKDVILKLDSMNIHRIYVTGEKDILEGVVTLRDIISKLVYEPPNYFGDFFDIYM